MTRAYIYRTLPSIFLTWYQLVLSPALAGQANLQRNSQEARTPVEALDHLLAGQTLPTVMVLLGRLNKAISAVVLADGSWAQAQHHEVTRSDQTGILTSRDQRHAQQDLRDAQRLAAGGRDAPLPTRGQQGRAPG